MPLPISIPRLGWNMEQGVFAGWLKQDGETVRVGDALFSLEGEKATEEIESLDTGTLRIAPDAPRVGDTIAVGTVIGYLVEPGEAVPVAEPPARRAPKPAAGPAARRLARSLGVDVKHVAAGSTGRVTAEDVQRQGTATSPRPAISPRARRVARELDVDWTSLRGGGKTGRIRERDVRAAAGERGENVAQPAPLSATRRVIAERLTTSLRSTAPVTLTTQADVTSLVGLRGQFCAAANAGDQPIPSITDFFVKLLAVALQSQPQFNARWDGDQLVRVPGIHIGIAVDTEVGLLVPVLRDVQNLSLRVLAASSRDVIARARSRQLSADEMRGGTFTVTNLGAFGIDAFTPIINYPEIAILGIGCIRRQPVFVRDQVVAREMVALSLTFDHRAVDGAPAARFLQALCAIVEAPAPWLIP